MRWLVIGVFSLVFFLFAALPPSPLDSPFEKATTEKAVAEGLLNNAQFKKAVKEALKAKQDQEKTIKNTPGFAGPTPAQAARVAFLKALNGGE